MKIVPSSELCEQLESFGFECPPVPRDSLYTCPSRKWLDKFSAWCKSHNPEYVPETFDCDDLALLSVVRASESLKKNTKLRNHGHALLYCTIEIKPEKSLNGIHGGSHATNIVRCDEVWFFFEPQTGEISGAAQALDSVCWPGFVLL